MKITNILLTVAMATSLAACEKSNADTATPADATAPDAPATDVEPASDDAMDDLGAEEPADDLGGDAAEPAGEEADAEAPTDEEAE